MRLNKFLPLILSLALLTPISYAQTPAGSPEKPGSAYGIEPLRHYPGTLVLELMQAAEEEIDAAVRDAYARGYKAAALRYVPELAERDRDIASLQKAVANHKAARRKYWRNAFVACGLSLLGGAAAGAVITGAAR